MNKAVLFRNGVLTDITPPSGVIAAANGLNDLDQVVGRVFFCDFVGGNCVNGRTRAFVFNGSTTTVLGTLGGRDSEAFGINNAGQIAGWSHTVGPPPGNVGDEHAFIFQNGIFEDLGAKTTARNSIASSINATGQVSGWGRSTTSDNGAFRYSAGTFQFFAATGTAWDINNAGQIVGVMGGNDDGTGSAFLFSGGVLQDLGKPSAQYKYALANAVNNAGSAQHQLVDLPVEFIGKIPGAPWLTQITVRLPDQVSGAGEIQIRISYRGQRSNPGSITIAPNP